jgi:threonine aldolase
MPPAYVKPYVKRQKNDAADAEAICEAVTRTNMRFVPIKTPEQQSGPAGARYYVRPSGSLNLGSDKILARLVTSFATQEDEIDRFARLCGSH